VSDLPGAPGISPIRRTIRYYLSRFLVAIVVRAWFRPRLDGRDRLPDRPAIYCFNHLSWSDPFMLMAVLPLKPRLFFFGPKEEDMDAGGRNRLMTWTGSAIPYKPGKNDLLEATRKVASVIDAGGVVAIAGEGRIHPRESELLPLSEGAAYFAIRSGIPLVPIALNGTSWLRFGGRVHVRVGEPFETTGRPSRAAIQRLTADCWTSLHAMVADVPELPEPGPVGRRLTELFNDWPEGSRDAALAVPPGGQPGAGPVAAPSLD
jgi:1-acyl-sn-glycerol-3-phosphate acyltransferase